MGTEPWKAFQYLTNKPTIGRNEPSQRWRKGDPLEVNFTIWKKPKDLLFFYATNVGVPRIVNVKVVPDNEAIILKYSEHLCSYLRLQSRVKNRGEDSRLKYKIKSPVRKFKLYCVSLLQCHSLRAQTSCLRNEITQQIQAGNILRLGSPFDKLA